MISRPPEHHHHDDAVDVGYHGRLSEKSCHSGLLYDVINSCLKTIVRDWALDKITSRYGKEEIYW